MVDYKALFGPTSNCACTQCRSLLGPAAYLVDVLQSLTDAQRAVLFDPGRRPDLQHLELSCNNTDTMLPHVDLANEVLENAIAPPSFNLTGDYVAGLNAKTLPAGLKQDFAAAGFALSTSATVAAVRPTILWTIRDQGMHYTVTLVDMGIPAVPPFIAGRPPTFAVQETRQTVGTVDDLAASPRHLNAKSYALLAQIVYGWDLPFDLGAIEARAFLDYLGVPRLALMTAFQTSGTPSDLAIASESLGLTRFERQIVTGGFAVRVASTTALTSLSGLGPIDGVNNLADGDLVLVKNGHTAPHGIYSVHSGAWVSWSDGDPAPSKSVLVRVGEGAQHDTQWVLTLDAGKVVVNPIQPWDFWGMTSTWLAAAPLPQVLPIQPTLQWVSIFLKQSGLSYQDLVDVLATRFVNKDLLLTVKFNDATNLCNLDNATFDRALTADDADRIHRLVRLMCAIGWTAREIDKAVTALGTGGLDDGLLLALAQGKALRAAYGLSVDEVLAFWGPIGSDGADALYARLFQNPAVYKPVDPAFVLTGSTSAATVDANAPALRAALGLGAADLDALVLAEESVSRSSLLTVDALSKLYRHALLARALGLSLADFGSFRSLISVDPFDATHVENTQRFASLVGKVRASGLSIAQLVYLATSVDPTSSIAPAEEILLGTAVALRDGLRKIAGDTAPAPDPDGDLTRRKLGLLWKSDVADQITAMLLGTAPSTPAFLDTVAAAFPDLDVPDANHHSPRDYLFKDVPVSPATVRLTVEEKLQYFLAILLPFLQKTLSEQFVKKTLAGALPLGLALIDALLSGPLRASMASFRALPSLPLLAVDSKGHWDGRLSASYNEPYAFHEPSGNAFRVLIDGKVVFDSKKNTSPVPLPAGQLLDFEVQYDLTSGVTAMNLQWSSPSTPREIIPAASLLAASTLKDFETAYVSLYKAALVIRGLQLTAKEVAYLSAHWTSLGGQWERILDLVALRKSFTPGPVEITDVFDTASLDGATLSGAEDLLARVTAWDSGTLGTLVTLFNLDLKDDTGLAKLNVCAKLVAQLGVRAEKALAWATEEPGLAEAQDIKSAAKAKYKNDEWLGVVKPIEDTLRNRRASALISYVLSQPPAALVKYVQAEDPNAPLRAVTRSDLFDYFLIDVEMDACMSTSRLKQAIGSVQLFVQRALMNLEPGVALGADQAEHWTQWMSRQQLWEANRGVFLYPENWIEPELRYHKTPPFVDLARELLLQADVTPAIVEDAYRRYLEKLHEVGRLQIAGVYKDDAGGVLHVVGRTWNMPHVYYYRRREEHADDGSVVWTPWERVDADIQGDHLVPVVWNRRLYLFWPLFTVKQDPSTPDDRKSNTDPLKYMEVQLAWSEYRNGAWSPKRLSPIDHCLQFRPQPFVGNLRDFFLDPKEYTLKVEGEYTQDLVIRCIHEFYELVDSTTFTTVVTPATDNPPPHKTSLGPGEVLNKGETIRSPDNQVKLEFQPDGFVVLTGPNGEQLWRPTSPTGLWATQFPPLVAKFERTVKYAVMTLTGDFVLVLDDVTADIGAGAVHLDTSAMFAIGMGSAWTSQTENHPNAILRVMDEGFLAIFDGPTQVWASNIDFLTPIVPTPDKSVTTPTTTTTAALGGSSIVGKFQLTACGGVVVSDPAPEAEELLYPHVEHLEEIEYGALQEIDHGKAFFGFTLVPDGFYLVQEDKTTELAVLLNTPTTYRVAFTQQDRQFLPEDRFFRGYYDHPFFFEDKQRTFLVEHVGDSIATELLSTAYPGFTQVMKAAMPYEQAPVAVGAARNPVALLATGAGGGGASAGLALQDTFWTSPTDDTTPPLFSGGGPPSRRRYRFGVFYHPYICEAIGRLEFGGIDGLLGWPMEQDGTTNPVAPINFEVPLFFSLFPYNAAYRFLYIPERDVVEKPYPIETLDFSTEGSTPYSQYNWELFFHAPLLIATQLSKRQRFADAQKWFHYIFNPTDRSGYKEEPARFWRFRKFFDDTKAGPPHTLEELLQQSADLGAMVTAWRDHPFDPHLIARTRLAAYQKNVVMKYVDNLIAWGDRLFRQESIESLNDATQLYVLASEILGDRPVTIPPPVTTQDTYTYADLTGLDAFSDQLVGVENLLQGDLGLNDDSGTGWRVVQSVAQQAEVFCIPGNDKLLGYWDTVADRLYKIRHCMNIEGTVRPLALWEPPIDPALLVAAAAAGVDLDTVLNDLNAPLPHYRFLTMVQKATELCADVKALGAGLLAALEKQDAEELAQLRAENEVALLNAIRGVKQKQVDEAREALAGLYKYQDVITTRQQYYQKLVAGGINANEHDHLDALATSRDLMDAQMIMEILVAVCHLIPDAKAGAASTVGTTYGGSNVGSSLQTAAGAVGIRASRTSTAGSISATLGSYDRRNDDWMYQVDLATKELSQVAKQIAAADIRVQITEKELANHDTQIAQSQAVDEQLRTKFSNRDLHLWMGNQISALYFQAYELAYDMARKAERVYQFERADFDHRFVQFGSWVGMRRGLLAGERLHQDLKQMEAAYLDQNRRDYEITKHISLVDLDPGEYLALRETGTCRIELPEALFDADFPGHFLRRVKSMSVTIPCITGPFDGVNCTLTLLRNSVRLDSKPGTNYARDPSKGPDARFRDNVGAVQAIVTSHGQNDAGLFETNFRDERFLPFEGAGAISEWRLELDPDCNRFDFKTITDVVLHLKYTARDGGDALKVKAKEAVGALVKSKDKTPLVHVFSARREFADEWHRFLHPLANQAGQSLSLDLADVLPYQPAGRGIKITRVDIFVKTIFVKTAIPVGNAPPIPIDLYVVDPSSGAPPLANLILKVDPAFDRDPTRGVVYHAHADFVPDGQRPGQWSLKIQDGTIPDPFGDHPDAPAKPHLIPDKVEDLWIACRFTRD